MSQTTTAKQPKRQTLRDIFELACPKCGQAETLDVVITTMARLTTDGTDPFGDHEWDDDSFCRCPECDHSGKIRAFRVQARRATRIDQPRTASNG